MGLNSGFKGLITILKCPKFFQFSSAAVKVTDNGYVLVIIIYLGYFVLRVKCVPMFINDCVGTLHPFRIVSKTGRVGQN